MVLCFFFSWSFLPLWPLLQVYRFGNPPGENEECSLCEVGWTNGPRHSAVAVELWTKHINLPPYVPLSAGTTGLTRMCHRYYVEIQKSCRGITFRFMSSVTTTCKINLRVCTAALRTGTLLNYWWAVNNGIVVKVTGNRGYSFWKLICISRI